MNVARMETKPKESPTYLEAKAMLQPELHPLFDELLEEYKFACLKHHGKSFVSPKVIAELVLMGWKSPHLLL